MKDIKNIIIETIKDWTEEYMLLGWCLFLFFLIMLAIFN